MTRTARLTVLMAAGLLMLATVGCDKLRARDQLNKGVASYKNAKYEEAIDHFQNAVHFDPQLLNAKLYLATAFAQQYIPDVDTPENNRNAEQAIDAYKAVLDQDPKNINSVKGIAYLYLNMHKFDKSKEYYLKAAQMDPNDAEPYYSVGVIDWTESYQPRMKARAELQLKPDEPLKDKKVCDTLKEQNWANIQDGIDVLNKAIQLRPDYDDAMAYMNLMYREKADLECSEPDARAADLKTADDWVDKTMATKKAKAAKQPQNQGIVLDNQGNSKQQPTQ
ncbi:MAG TPA: tetratricopeptide repeat protein [Terriglobales bacterium]